MNPDRPGRKASDANLAAMLARGWSRSRSAAECQVSKTTVYRRLRDPAFVALVAEKRAELVSQAVGILSAIAGKSAETLAGLLKSEDESVRMRAADLALSHLVRTREHAEFQTRLERIEALMSAR
jgi:hypothetical protein